MESSVTILSDVHCHLGEGVAWLPQAQRVCWFDIVEKALFEHRLDDGRTVRHSLPFMASVIAEIDGERQLVAADEGLFVRSSADGAFERLLPLEADKPGNRSNDGRVHQSGALWIGTMGRNAEKSAGAVYWYAGGRAVRLFADITIPNAICFSPDGGTAYFVDSDVGELMRVAVNPDTGLPVGAPAVLRRHGGHGALDGAVVDTDGAIWVAHWGGACVEAYSPAGDIVKRVSLPATNISCPGFVGDRLDRMVATSAWQGMGDARKAAEPAHGNTFLFDPGVRGLPWPAARPFA
ncbi:SMP-30/gluconolactonase/LRE family protein [Aureimonas altamirensis]|uniref:SMP-30/gluconolactonase/LRE family protein n=1 Tax=Aureimonas altamirensis TaxID=370622 RepID=UPI002557A421|nr:SMP-30/gluconolactonase/LRE family protein [Aureimonas altamirensis]